MIDTVIAIAHRAGDLVMTSFGGEDLKVRTKSDDSPQSRADRESHHLIVKALADSFEEPILSEEHRIPWAARRGWKALWLVDPLDGSREFLAGIPEFAVSIARVEGGVPTHGVVYMPATEVTYLAVRGEGAFVERHGVRRRLPLTTPPRAVMARSRFHDVPEASTFATLNGVSDSRPVGSALKFGLLAEGELSVYPRFEECKEWDTAAGHLILTEAGGAIRDLVTGAEPVYNKPHIANNPFVACAPGVSLDSLSLP